MSRNLTTSFKVIVNTLYRATRLYISNRSLQAYKQAALHIYLKLRGKAPVITSTLATTNRCQSNCIHCFAAVKGRGKGDEMSTEEMKDAIDQMKAVGSLILIFSGGESLLREDLVELVAHAHKIGLLTRLSTNGYLLTRERVAELKRAGLNQCGVSIDDADPETHDRLRGLPGCFESAVQGLRYLHEFKINTKILVYASRRNVTEGLERIIELGRQLKVLSVYILIPVAAGRWEESHQEVLSEEEMARVISLYDYKFVHLEFSTAKTNCCAYNKSIVYVGANGDVTPCPFIPYEIGNIHNEPLTDIWRRHVSLMQLESRGNCPLNDIQAREALQRHTDSVLYSGTRQKDSSL